MSGEAQAQILHGVLPLIMDEMKSMWAASHLVPSMKDNHYQAIDEWHSSMDADDEHIGIRRSTRMHV